MSVSFNLIEHALDLLQASRPPEQDDVYLRRAVSAAYYGLYHHLTVEAASLIAPNVSLQTRHRIGRWFEHAEMKKVCGRFAKPRLDQPLRELIGESASPSLQAIATNFIKLQEARHAADYELSYAFTAEEALEYVELSVQSFDAWSLLRNSAEANVFLLSLVMWKNWERQR